MHSPDRLAADMFEDISLVSGNQIDLLENGQDYFPLLLESIRRAEESIALETYIFAKDTVGQAVAAMLEQAAERGLAVRVMVDGYGSPRFMEDFGNTLSARGVNVLIYRPKPLSRRFGRRFGRYRLRRLHRKLVVIDGYTAFVGGINIVDDHNNLGRRGQLSPRLDYAICVKGPLVARILHSMDKLWLLVRWSQLQQRGQRDAFCPMSPLNAGTMSAAFLIRDNLRHRRDIENAYITAIGQARREIWLANAYFLPGKRFREALINAAQRGVSVTLLLQGQVEYWIQHYATRALYRELQAAGVVIYEYRRSFLHAKVAVIDDHWATVGSSNIDPFSLLLAREANLVIADQAFAKQLQTSLSKAIAHGGHKIPDVANHASLWHRLFEKLAYFIIRAAVSLTRYDKEKS